jgi:hypothetical protein
MPDPDKQQPSPDAGGDTLTLTRDEIQAIIAQEFYAIQQGASDAGAYSGGSRPKASDGPTLEDTEDNLMSSNAGDGGGSSAFDQGAYSLYDAHAGSRARGSSPNTPPAYTAGDQPGSTAGLTGDNVGIGGEATGAAGAFEAGGLVGLIASVFSDIFGGGKTHEPEDLTRYAMPASMEFTGTTDGGTTEDSLDQFGQARAAVDETTTTTADTAETAAPSTTGAPETSTDPEQWIQQNASAIASAVNSQILMSHPIADTIANL